MATSIYKRFTKKRYVPKKKTSSKKKPARFNASRKRYSANRSIAKMLRNYGETKYLPTRVADNYRPNPIQTGAVTYYYGWVLGDLPNGWDSQLQAIDGISTQQGDGGVSQRVGNYVYLKKNHFQLQIDMLSANANGPGGGSVPLHEFRVVVCKQRRLAMPAGRNPAPQEDLFLQLDNAKWGYTSTGFDGNDMIMQPLNKRDWTIHYETKFTLTPSPDLTLASTSPNVYNQRYPSSKRLEFNLPFYKKTRYAQNLLGLQFPTDIDYHYCVLVFARPVGNQINQVNPPVLGTAAKWWVANIRSVTTYTDN